jgi:hypothetical protein
MDRYKHNDDGTITDTETGLMWQGESTGLMTWDEAMAYAESLGDGWRLPTIQELIGLIDFEKHGSATGCPRMHIFSHWSSTNYAYDASYAWGVSFGNGYVSYHEKTSSYAVRCVR